MVAFIPIDLFRTHVAGQFKALSDFIEHSEAQLQESYHTIRAQIVSELGTGPAIDEEPEEWLSRYDEEVGSIDIRYQIAFSRVMRFSFVVMAFTLLESNLIRIANEISRRRGLGQKWNCAQGTTVLQCFEKFWIEASLPPWEEGTWTLPDQVRALRNVIAHRNGWLAEDRSNQRATRDDDIVRELMSENVGVSLVEDGPLIDPDDIGSVMIKHDFSPVIVQRFILLIKYIFDRAGCFGKSAPSE